MIAYLGLFFHVLQITEIPKLQFWKPHHGKGVRNTGESSIVSCSANPLAAGGGWSSVQRVDMREHVVVGLR